MLRQRLKRLLTKLRRIARTRMPFVHAALAQGINDHAIDHALSIASRSPNHGRSNIVGVIGGHSKTRADESWSRHGEADVQETKVANENLAR